MSTAALELDGVCKRYRYFSLQDVSLRLEQGQIMGLVGPNGAGKTTIMKILMALVRQDAGEVRVLGCAMPAQQLQAKWDIGFVSEEMRLFADANLSWHMELVRSVYPGWDQGYADTLLKRFQLHPQQPSKGLSRGEQIKALLLLVLARRPRLLVLDEATAGLDPVARHEIIGELMAILNDEQRSVLFSSHNTMDVEQISDQITFIDRGRVLDSGDRETYIDSWRRITLELPEQAPLPALPGLVEAKRSGRLATLTVKGFHPQQAAECERCGARVTELMHMTLEEIFVASVMHGRRERGE